GQEPGEAAGFDGAAVARAPGDPGDAGAGGGGEFHGGGEGAFDGGQSLAEEDDGARFGEGVVDGATVAPAVEDLGLFAGEPFDEVRLELAGAAGGVGGEHVDPLALGAD